MSVTDSNQPPRPSGPSPGSLRGSTSSGTVDQPPDGSAVETLSQRAYLLEWDDDDHGRDETPRACRRTPLSTPDAVRAALAQHPATRQEPSRKLVVVSGLQPALVEALVASDLRVDPAFVECYAAARAYRPATSLRERALRRRVARRAGEPALAPHVRCHPEGGYVWEYPELLETPSSSATVPAARTPDGELGMAPPVGSFPSRDGKELVVAFCRAGLWMGKRASVLLLNRLVLDGLHEGALWPSGETVVAGEGQSGQKERTREEDLASFQGIVLDALMDGWESDDQLAAILSEAVYSRWLELFDCLDTGPPALGEKTVSSYLQMMRSLERNDEGDTDVDWRGLLSRLQRRVDLLSIPRNQPLIPPQATLKTTTAAAATETPRVARELRAGREIMMSPAVRGGVSKRMHEAGPADENQRALDRLSYLGGILIPLPIVSGILSMGDTYGPDGGRFFVFWAAAIPLAGLAVILIYADTIRKSEVWVEISADRVALAPESKSARSSDGVHIPVNVEVKEHRTVTWQRHQAHENGSRPSSPPPPPPPPPQQQHHEEAVVYSVDYDVEEQNIGVPTPASVHASDEELPEVSARVLDWMPAPGRWRTGRSWAPTVVLEHPADGSKPKAWKREELGWFGAIQRILYKRFRDGNDIPTGMAALERPARRSRIVSRPL